MLFLLCQSSRTSIKNCFATCIFRPDMTEKKSAPNMFMRKKNPQNLLSSTMYQYSPILHHYSEGNGIWSDHWRCIWTKSIVHFTDNMFFFAFNRKYGLLSATFTMTANLFPSSSSSSHTICKMRYKLSMD
jgi:hypothetical protein